MNRQRATEAIKDLMDCTETFKNRSIRQGFIHEGENLLRIATTIKNRFEELMYVDDRIARSSSWSVLYSSLEKETARAEDLLEKKVLDEEEVYFIQECLDEVHKFIRRTFAKRGMPEWRRGA